MVYRRSTTNVRKPARRRAPTRRTYRRTNTRSRYRRGPRTSKGTGSRCHCPPGQLSPSARFALAQLDPFHPDAQGAKVPDSNTMPSISNAATDQVSCPAATSGWLTGFAFRPAYNAAVIDANPVSAGIVSWPVYNGITVYNRNGIAEIRSAFEAIRPVAHAVRLVSPLAPTSTTGFVHIGLSVESMYNSAGSAWQYPTTVSQMTGLAHYKRITLASLTQSPITAINKWIDERAFQYQDPLQQATLTATTGGEVQSPFGMDWCAIVVLVEGAPAGSVPLSAEHLLLSEGLPQKTGVLIGTQAAPNSPGTMSATSSMSAQQEFTHTEATQDSYINQGLNAFAAGARQQGEQVFNNYALPLLAQAGRLATSTAGSYAMNAIMGRGGLPGQNSNINRLALN